MTAAVPSCPPFEDDSWRPSRDFFGGPPPVDPADPTNVPSEPMGEVPPEVVFTAGGAIAAPSQARRYASGGFLPAGDLSKAPEWLRESDGCVIPLGRLTKPERQMLEVALEKIGTPPGSAHYAVQGLSADVEKAEDRARAFEVIARAAVAYIDVGGSAEADALAEAVAENRAAVQP